MSAELSPILSSATLNHVYLLLFRVVIVVIMSTASKLGVVQMLLVSHHARTLARALAHARARAHVRSARATRIKKIINPVTPSALFSLMSCSSSLTTSPTVLAHLSLSHPLVSTGSPVLKTTQKTTHSSPAANGTHRTFGVSLLFELQRHGADVHQWNALASARESHLAAAHACTGKHS